MAATRTVSDRVSVASTRAADPARLRDGLLPGYARFTFGLVHWRGGVLHLGPLALIRLGDPVPRGAGWAWPIEGGLLAARGGYLGVGADPGGLYGWLEDYRPSLPWRLYGLTQRRLHRLLTRLYLLQLRGRTPPPGMPATPAARIAAAGLDLGLCGCLALGLTRRRRLKAWLALAGLYHIAFWSWGGQTPAARLLRLRLVSLDGSPVSPGQALIRLLAIPQALRDLTASHDVLAATEVIEA